MPVRIRVRARGDSDRVVGYYNHKRVKGGQIFYIEGEKAFSEIWMEKIDSSVTQVEEKPEGKKGRGKKRSVADDNMGSALIPDSEDGDVL